MKRNSHMESTERKSLHFLIFQYVLPVRVIWTTRAHTGPAAQRLDVWRICMCWESAAGRDSPIQQEYSRISKGSEVECWPPLYWQGFIPSVILDGIVQKLPTSHEVNTLAWRRLQDLRRCPLLLYESKTVSLQEAAATHQSPETFLISATLCYYVLKGWNRHSWSCVPDYIPSSAYLPMNNYTSVAFMCCYNISLYPMQHQYYFCQKCFPFLFWQMLRTRNTSRCHLTGR